MSVKTRALPAVLGLAGVAVITGLVIYYGVGEVTKALAGVRLPDFALYIVAQLCITAGLGLCWRILLRSRKRGSFWLCVWGRLVRDATGEFLPFSQVGGYVLGARIVTLHGVDAVDAVASTFADITVEFLAELIFIAGGLLITARLAPHSWVLVPVGAGLCIAVFMGAGLVMVQQNGANFVRDMALKVAGDVAAGAAHHMGRLHVSLGEVWRRRNRLVEATLLHLVCWIGTATASYIGFRALGVPVTFPVAMAIEALLHAIVALAFFIPGRVGIQEAGYALLGPIFGIPPEIALSLSLLRRGRDFLIAVPVLLLWQGVEARRLRFS
jgi:putative membrane protein